MKATINISGVSATLEGWTWSSTDRQLARLLNVMLDPDGPSGADPAPNTHEARRVAQLLGGEVVDYELPPYDKDAVY